jgi:putative flippase GtrA
MRPLAARLLAVPRMIGDLVNYGLASVAALALDYSLLLLCHNALGLAYPIAVAIGFSSGLALVYLLSIWFVFDDRRSIRPGLEFSAFMAIGVAGLVLTETLIHLFVDRFGLTPAIAKIPTAGFVFLFNFVTRRGFLFSRATPRARAPA